MRLPARPAVPGRAARVRRVLLGTIRRVAVPACAVVVASGAALFVAALASPAAAADGAPGGPGLPPALAPYPRSANGVIDLVLRPGSAAIARLSVANLGNAVAHEVLYVADATTAPGSGIAYGGPSSADDGTAAWVELGTRAITLAPRQEAIVALRVAVPAHARPGDHLAGIAAYSSAPPARGAARSTTPARAGITIKAAARVVLAVLVRVPGPATLDGRLEAATLATPPGGAPTVTLRIANTGDLLFAPALEGEIRRCAAPRPLFSFERQAGLVLPDSATTYSVVLASDELAPGCYDLRLAMSTDGRVIARLDASTRLASRAPLPAHRGGSALLGALVAALALVLLVGVLARRGLGQRRYRPTRRRLRR